jgi:hypothetical protein
VNELETLHIGIKGIMMDRQSPLEQQTAQSLTCNNQSNYKPKRVMTEKQLAHMANMRAKKAEKH